MDTQTLHYPPSPDQESHTMRLLSPKYKVPCCKRRENMTRVWILVVAPLFGHFLFTIAITVFVLVYIDDNIFYITSRRPTVTQFNHDITPSEYHPLQSDITTSLSFGLNLMRVVAGVWTAATVWRCVFILMEKTGISLQDINWMLAFNLPPKRVARKNRTVMLVTILLLAALPSQFSSPILTGSITWKPEWRMVQGNQPVEEISRSENGEPWVWYREYSENVLSVILRAVAIADTTWGGIEGDETTMKRVLSSARYLPINSTLANVTVPYFAIDSLEWIKDPNTTLTQNQIRILMLYDHDTPYTPFFVGGPMMGLIPDESWGPSSNTTFPAPSIVSETRALCVLHRKQLNGTCPRDEGYFGTLSTNIGIFPTSTLENCYACAQVTYKAGAAVCRDCRISVPAVVQNTAALQLEADAVTVEALALMPRLIGNMGMGNFSVPHAFDNINNYSVQALTRSYQAAWTALTDYLRSRSTFLTTDVTIPIPASQAIVQHWRVYIWLGLNILFTLSGFLFFIVQMSCRKPLVDDTAIAALLLDTRHVLENDNRGLHDLSMLMEEDSQIGLLDLGEDENGRRVVTVRKVVEEL